MKVTVEKIGNEERAKSFEKGDLVIHLDGSYCLDSQPLPLVVMVTDWQKSHGEPTFRGMALNSIDEEAAFGGGSYWVKSDFIEFHGKITLEQ